MSLNSQKNGEKEIKVSQHWIDFIWNLGL